MKNIHQASVELKALFSGIVFVITWKFLRTAIKNDDVGVFLLKKHTILNKKFCNIDFNNFLIIFFVMYKKHDLLIGFIFSNNIFRHLRIF